MVLKRKLPTQTKQEKKNVEKEENNLSQFDMSIEGEQDSVKEEKKAGHDVAESDTMQQGEKPADFIPDELRAMEAENSEETPQEEVPTALDEKPVFEEEEEKSIFDEEPVELKVEEPEPEPVLKEDKIKIAETPVVEEPIMEEPKVEEPIIQEPVVMEDPIQTQPEEPKQDEPTDAFVNLDAAPAELPGGEEILPTETVVQKEPSFDSFEKIEEPKEDDISGISWDEEPKQEAAEEKQNEFAESKVPNLDEDVLSSVELMGEDHQLLTMNDDGKKKIIIGIFLVIALIAGFVVFSGDKDTNRWDGVVKSEKSEQGSDIKNDSSDEGTDLFGASDFDEDEESDKVSEKEETTTISLLEPEEKDEESKTASGKEIVKAEDGEKIPGEDEILKELGEDETEIAEEDSEEKSETKNLFDSISEEIEKQKAAQGNVIEDQKSETNTEGSRAKHSDINSQVDEQLAEYRKLLAAEEDPGKKLKPGAFFEGERPEQVRTVQAPVVSKVELERNTKSLPQDYVLTDKQVGGRQIIEYPQPVTREKVKGIRTLDDFRTSIIKKKDKRVRMPKHLRPALRDQGFPKIKVVSIVPNYGLIAMYNGKKGILMIGDSIQGWELVGVYRTYAEFKLGNRKHIITLTI